MGKIPKFRSLVVISTIKKIQKCPENPKFQTVKTQSSTEHSRHQDLKILMTKKLEEFRITKLQVSNVPRIKDVKNSKGRSSKISILKKHTHTHTHTQRNFSPKIRHPSMITFYICQSRVIPTYPRRNDCLSSNEGRKEKKRNRKEEERREIET